jgi:uncharacterized membrane protein YeaQ/YmgE (transglycosylase-associated protein family)
MAAGQDDQTLMGAGMDTGSLAEANALAGAGWGTFVILGALAGWFTGRTLRTGGLLVAYVLLGVAGALVGGFILSFVFESASSGVLFHPCYCHGRRSRTGVVTPTDRRA